MKCINTLFALLLLHTSVLLWGAQHIEFTHGEISDNRLNPTPILLTEGGNIIGGNVNGDIMGISSIDLDYFTIIISTDFTLEQINLLDYNNNAPDGNVSFIGFQQGPIFSVDPASVKPDSLLGWAHLGEDPVGSDLLFEMQSAPGAIGYTAPLIAGTYTFWIQETAAGFAGYGLNFEITAAVIPESPSYSCFLGLACVFMLRTTLLKKLMSKFSSSKHSINPNQ